MRIPRQLMAGPVARTVGLMHDKARADDPLLMRFVQPDSIIPNPADPQGWEGVY